LSFSERHGYRPTTKEFQIESVDEDLRNSLWNVIYEYYFEPLLNPSEGLYKSPKMKPIFYDLWGNYLKQTIDDIQFQSCNFMISSLKKIFTQNEWFRMYDIVEILTNHTPLKGTVHNFIESCNLILEREFSGYRFVGNTMSKITSTEEVQEIEEAIESGIDSIKSHLSTSLSMLSDRKSPDYRNSIKESISSVESICKLITGNSDTTMGGALQEIETSGKIKLHSDMKESFQKLYSYTNDASGIRHSLMDGKIKPDFDDAKFMLVSCSAIVNFLISKSNKAGINLNS